MIDEVMVSIGSKYVVTEGTTSLTLPQKSLAEFEDKLLELWVECAAVYNVEYTIIEEGSMKVAKPVDEQAARLRDAGSGSQGITAENWFAKAKNDCLRQR